jgi:hypothetical protein
MSGEIFQKELRDRMKGMSAEDMAIAVRAIPSDVMWNELRRRYAAMSTVIDGVKDIVREEGD